MPEISRVCKAARTSVGPSVVRTLGLRERQPLSPPAGPRPPTSCFIFQTMDAETWNTERDAPAPRRPAKADEAPPRQRCARAPQPTRRGEARGRFARAVRVCACAPVCVCGHAHAPSVEAGALRKGTSPFLAPDRGPSSLWGCSGPQHSDPTRSAHPPVGSGRQHAAGRGPDTMCRCLRPRPLGGDLGRDLGPQWRVSFPAVIAGSHPL